MKFFEDLIAGDNLSGFFRNSLTPIFILLAVILRYTIKFFSIKQSIFS